MNSDNMWSLVTFLSLSWCLKYCAGVSALCPEVFKAQLPESLPGDADSSGVGWGLGLCRQFPLELGLHHLLGVYIWRTN